MTTILKSTNPLTICYGGGRFVNPATGQFYIKMADQTRAGPFQVESSRTTEMSVRRKKPVGIALLTSQTGLTGERMVKTMSVVRDNTGGVGVASMPWAPINGLDHLTSKADLKARQKMLEKIKDTSWNLSTFLGEMPETWHYVSSVAKSLVSSYRAVKRGDMRSLHRLVLPSKRGTSALRSKRFVPRNTANYQTEYWSGKWMEWRYAVQPMLYDFDDALKALYESRARPLISHVRTTGGSDDRFDKSTSYRRQIISGTCRARYSLYYRVDPMADGFKRLGLLNPLETLYELAPLSFVLDWFLPIGDYLASLDAMAGVTVIGGTCSYKSNLFGNQQEIFSNDSWFKQYASEANTTIESYSRTTSVPVNMPVPQFSLGLNAKRVIDGVSLLRLGLRGTH